ncbi:MAG TPA: DUF3224 domain-containing protein [Solirubrobacteraceae bacterium]|nr:DUF3224 domain-containing protein [Solirubrobacteraceae bacterium]
MSTAATFKIDSWDEQPYVENDDGSKLTRAHVEQTFEGDIAGQGEVEWLMCYRPDETADYVGLQRIVGRVGERSGSLVLISTGTFDGTEAKGPLTIVRGSGTGELEGIAGDGELRAPMGSQPSVELDYRFE